MAQTFLPDGTPLTYEHEHTCTWEERRFGTCKCRAAAIRAAVAAQRSGRQPDHEQWAPAQVDYERFRAQLMQHLATVPCHDRLRFLRTVMRWTQRELACQLGISRRRVIRYENAQQRSEWPRLSVLLRLRQVEADHEQQLIGHFARVGH